MVWIDIPLTNELRMDIARLEIPVSGWTCFRTKARHVSNVSIDQSRLQREGEHV
jgi:hypothetical protein